VTGVTTIQRQWDSAALAQVAEARRQELRRLGQLDRRVVVYNVAYLAGVWGVLAAAVMFAARRPRWWSIGLATLVVAGRQHALLNVEHECIHGIFVPGKTRNTSIGRWLCASPCGSPYEAAKQTHLRHHRLVGKAEDPDRELHAGTDKATRWGMARYFVTNLLGGYAMRSIIRRRGDEPAGDGTGPGGAAPVSGDVPAIAIAQIALWAITGSTLGWWVYPALWAAPLGTITAFCHLVRSFGEHALAAHEEGRYPQRLISTKSNPIELALLSPYNMNYHAEHHLHPFVPAARLPQVTPMLPTGRDGPPVLVRRSYARTLIEHFRSLPRASTT
jgi:fatty acid desaturase